MWTVGTLFFEGMLQYQLCKSLNVILRIVDSLLTDLFEASLLWPLDQESGALFQTRPPQCKDDWAYLAYALR